MQPQPISNDDKELEQSLNDFGEQCRELNESIKALEQETRFYIFSKLDVYESICSPDTYLIPLLTKYDKSLTINQKDDGFYIFSDVLGLEIVGNHIGSIKVKPNIKNSSISDWYSEKLWGYQIKHFIDGLEKDSPNDNTYPFLEELQDIFFEVGTAKKDLDSLYLSKKDINSILISDVVFKNLLFGVAIYLYPEPILFIAPITYNLFMLGIALYYNKNRPQLQFNKDPYAEESIRDEFNKIYKH